MDLVAHHTISMSQLDKKIGTNQITIIIAIELTTFEGPPLVVGFQWDREAHVNVIVTVKKIGR